MQLNLSVEDKQKSWKGKGNVTLHSKETNNMPQTFDFMVLVNIQRERKARCQKPQSTTM